MSMRTTRTLLTTWLVLASFFTHSVGGAGESGPKDSIAQLRERGAVVELDDHGDAVSVELYGENTNDDLKLLCGSSKLTVLDIDLPQATDAEMATVGEFEILRDLNLMNASVTTPGIKHLTKLKQLRRLNLRFTKVDDEVVAYLTQLPNLEELWLGWTKVTDAGMEGLGRITSLRSLSLTNDKITDAGIAHLVNLPNLRTLVLHSTEVTDRGLELLGGMTDLEELYLGSLTIGEPGFGAISKLPNLKVLYLSSAQVGDEAIAPLACAARIEKLYLDSTEIGDAGLQEMGLAKMKNLRVLWLPRNNVTDRGAALVAGLSELRELYMPRTDKVTEAGMKCVSGLAKLEFLVASEGTSDATMAEIGKLVNLKSLRLVGSRVTDAGLVHLKGLPKLEDLDLSICRVTDAGLSTLSELTQLRELVLVMTPITDDGLMCLESLTNLRKLSVNSTMVSKNAVERLKTVLPNTDIYGGRVRVGFIEFDQNDPRVKAERKELAGTWEGHSIPDKGEKSSDGPKARLRFAGGQMTIFNETGESVAGSYKLDPTMSPKWLDTAMELDGWVFEKKAIYELDSGVLRISVVDAEEERPKGFSDEESKYAHRSELIRVDDKAE